MSPLWNDNGFKNRRAPKNSDLLHFKHWNNENVFGSVVKTQNFKFQISPFLYLFFSIKVKIWKWCIPRSHIFQYKILLLPDIPRPLVCLVVYAIMPSNAFRSALYGTCSHSSVSKRREVFHFLHSSS